MVKIKKLKENEFNLILAEKGFQKELLVKDYYITIILFLIKDVRGIYFKGGTALQKTILEYSRLSEDIDFTLDRNIELVKNEIIVAINESGLFDKIVEDKNVNKFIRLVVPYNTYLGRGNIFIDLNQRANLLLKPEKISLNSFYPNLARFFFLCVNKNEMIAEKVSAAITRNKPRDHYDIYQIIKHKQKIDMALVKKKCKQSKQDSSILKMFNKAKKLHKKWDEDMIPLLKEDVSFKEVMQTLAKHFKLKQEKDSKK